MMPRDSACRSCLMTLLCLVLAGLFAPPAFAWEYWGGDPGGTRFSTIPQITPGNVGQLVRAWEFRTGDLMRRDAKVMARTKFEATPLFVEDSLILCTPFNEVIALDPGTGTQKWRFDSKVSLTQRPANRYDCRGVAYWVDRQAPAQAACRARVFMGTNDMRVIALDAGTGKPCSDFGEGGEVKLDVGMPLEWPGEMQITSPPVVARDVVVVGSSIADNRRTAAPRGTVRAFDARTGGCAGRGIRSSMTALRPARPTSGRRCRSTRIWGWCSCRRPRRVPIFGAAIGRATTSMPNSVVALRAETGELVWAFQTVHHDVWDYDLPAQPTLARIDTGAGQRDVVIQATKQGFLFVLDEATGQPIWPVEERPVPQGGAEGEQLSPTQPFPTHTPTLVPQRISADDAFGLISRAACHDKLARARNEGLYTPPSTQGTVIFPSTGGGVNWGGVAFDPIKQILYANTLRFVHIVTLIPAAEARGFKPAPGEDFGPQRGAAFAMTRAIARSPLGSLCNPPPCGALVAVDLKAGTILWQSTVGTTEDLAPLGLPFPWGTPVASGVLVTEGGLVFSGALDAYLRAFDARTGAELWQGRLPVPGVANPMTYVWQGEQYVVIAAGGHSEAGTSIGDSVVAFRLARTNEAPSLWSRTIDRPGGRLYASIILMAVTLALAVTLAVALRRWRRQASAG